MPLEIFYGLFSFGVLGAFWLGLKEVKILTIVTQAIKDCDMYKDGSIWIVWVFKFAFFILRGAFFPLFYLNLMLFGSIKLQNELKECEKIKTELNA